MSNVQQTTNSTISEKIAIAAITSFFSTLTVGMTVGLPLWMELMKAKIEREKATVTIVETTKKAEAAVISNEATVRDIAKKQKEQFNEFKDVIIKATK